MGHPALSWGVNITKVTLARADYIASLKEADKSNYEPLKYFMFANHSIQKI